MSEVVTKKTHKAITEEGSMLSRYQNVIVGSNSLFDTIYYEWCTWLNIVPGAVGIFLRKLFWPRLFAFCGKGVMFGSNVILRHPNRIHLGNRVIISDGCILDARNDSTTDVLRLNDDVILSNFVVLSCKNGTIEIGKHTGIGTQTVIQSTNGCPITLGDDNIIGPRCYLVGGGNYHTDRLDVPIWHQGIKPDSGVQLANDIWLGANVTILGGVSIGKSSIVASGAVVTKSVPEGSVSGGVPAKIIKKRNATKQQNNIFKE